MGLRRARVACRRRCSDGEPLLTGSLCRDQPCRRAAHRPDSCHEDQRKAARISQFSQAGRWFPGLFMVAAPQRLGELRALCQGVALEGRKTATAPMPSPALVSFLGFPGWGPLHLQLAMGGDPQALARRLARARASAGSGAAPGALLAAFLRQQGDGHPLGEPWGPLPPGGRSGSHRYRIVCAPGCRPRLRLAGWCWDGPARGWRPCAEPQPLALFLERHGQAAPRCRRIGEESGAIRRRASGPP